MPKLSDSPIARKRDKLRRTLPSSRADAMLHGTDVFYADIHCGKCGTWAAQRVEDGACCGCYGGGPYAGDKVRRRRKALIIKGYYYGRSFRADVGRKLLDDVDVVCRACDARIMGQHSFDHIFPYALGGPSEIWNAQILCKDCQCQKGYSLPDDWFCRIGREMPQSFIEGFSKFHKVFTGSGWNPGDDIDLDALPRNPAKSKYKRKNPTKINRHGKLILTPAKHWHKDYRGKRA